MAQVTLQGIEISPKEIPDSGLVVTLLKEVEFLDHEKTGFESDYYEMNVKTPDGIKRVYRANKTSYREIIAAYGSEDDNWPDKKVKLTKVPTSKGSSGYYIKAVIEGAKK